MTLDTSFVRDDLTGAATRALLAAHLSDMRAHTPLESVHALDLGGLRHPNVAVYTARQGEDVVAVGALQRLGPDRAEVKSMRVADSHRGLGLGRAMLSHLELEARGSGIRSLWLETGSGPEFVAARALYAGAGYRACAPFASYRPDPLSVFLTKDLVAPVVGTTG